MLSKLKQPIRNLSSQNILRQKINICEQYGAGLKHYLSTALPSRMTSLESLEFLALDFETSGLNPKSDEILSIGWVEFSCKKGIQIGSTREVYLANSTHIKADSAAVNGITSRTLKNGIKPSMAMDDLLSCMAGKVIVAHCSEIERGFITHYLKRHLGLKQFPGYFVDTLKIEKRYSFTGRQKEGVSFQLGDTRQRYRLPLYPEHSAASDALACAELLLAQLKKLPIPKQSRLSHLV